jgi:hypothetical protein
VTGVGAGLVAEAQIVGGAAARGDDGGGERTAPEEAKKTSA